MEHATGRYSEMSALSSSYFKGNLIFHQIRYNSIKLHKTAIFLNAKNLTEKI